MRKQDQLTALIRSLTQGEKKYFMQRSRTGTGSKSYVKLYKLLLGSHTYNPQEISLRLKKNKAGLANEKKYLEKNILASLREYHDNHPQLSILNRIAEGILLMEKNLPLQATASVQRAVGSATATNNWPTCMAG